MLLKYFLFTTHELLFLHLILTFKTHSLAQSEDIKVTLHPWILVHPATSPNVIVWATTCHEMEPH